MSADTTMSMDTAATDFLRSTGTTLDLTYLRTAQYFPVDRDSRTQRNIYRFVLRNTRGEYSGEFGASVYASQADIPPSSYDVLACLTTSDPGTFENFVGDYGYAHLPISQYETVMGVYTSVKEEVRGLRRLFSDEELERLAEIN